MPIPVDPNSPTTAQVGSSQFLTAGFFGNLLNSLSEPILVKNRQHQWVFFNSAFRSLMGYGQESFIGFTDRDVLPQKEAALFWERDEHQFVTEIGNEVAEELPEQLTNAHGQSLQLLTRRHLFHNEIGEPFLVCSFSPIPSEPEEMVTQQSQREVNLRQREVTHRALIEAIPDLLIRMQRDGTYLDFSFDGDFKPSAIQATQAKTIFDLMPEPLAQKRIYYTQQALDTGELQVYEQELVINGDLVYEEVRVVPSGDDEVLTIIRDVTARKQAQMALQQLNEALEQEVEKRTIQLKQAIVQLEQEIRDRKQAKAQLQQQEQFLRSIYQGIEHQIFVIDVFGGDFRYSGWNHFTERFLKISSEAALNKTPEDLFGAKEGSQVRQRYNECWQTGKTISYEERLRILGRPAWFITTLSPLKDEAGQVYRLVGMTLDITDRKQAELALQESEKQLRQQAFTLENTLRELQRTQTQLIQNEKMSSLGQLVAGVAHEINNPVNFIYGNLKHADEYTQDILRLIRLYQQLYPDPAAELQAEAEAIDLDFLIEDLPKLLNSMKVGADRIQQIVASLRNFSRMDEAEMKTVNIHEGIDSTLMILQNRLKPKSDSQPVEVVKEYGTLPLVECYAGQLNQVFMNLLSNAIDALEEAIAVKPSSFIPQITIHTELTTPSQITIQITDNGCGMPLKVQQRMFDPFFTTKPIGKGTGMGLSISHQIVTEKHQGKLWCDSSPETGTRFVIEIPIYYG